MINVLLTYTTLIPSVRFCALYPLEYLAKNKDINLISKTSHKVTSADLNLCDVLVMVRCCEDRELEIAQKCKKTGRKLVYVLDDDLLNVPESIECHKYYSIQALRDNMTGIMQISDVLWSPNPNLIKKYGNMFDKCVIIDEPFIGNIKLKEQTNEEVRIGFAGTETHRAFIDGFLGNVLKSVKYIYKDKVSIEFFGFKPDFLKEIEGVYIPYCDNYEQYCSIMRERNWDIGLAPLEQSEFASCKYFNKYIEYSSYGIVGVYSDVQPYVFGIKDKINGILAENTVEGWINAIRMLIEDKELLNKISQFAQEELQTKFNVESVAEKIYDKEVFVKCSKNDTIEYKKKFFFAEKLKIYTQVYGVYTLVIILNRAYKKIMGIIRRH